MRSIVRHAGLAAMAVLMAVGIVAAGLPGAASADAARPLARFEPPTGRDYMGVSEPGGADQVATFDAAAGIDQPAIYSRYVAPNGPLGPSLTDGSFDPSMTMMLSWDVTFSGGAVTSGSDDSYLAAQVAAVRAYGQPVFLRLDWEMNTPWNTNYDMPGVTPKQYIASWRYIVARFAGVRNVAFVWAPAANEHSIDGVQYPAADWYPGDGVVDWIGLDAYPQYAPDNWLLNGADGLNATASFAQSHGKPLMLSEWSPNLPNPDTADPIDLIIDWAASWPATVKALVYFDYDASTGDHTLVDHPVGAAKLRRLTANRTAYLTTGAVQSARAGHHGAGTS